MAKSQKMRVAFWMLARQLPSLKQTWVRTHGGWFSAFGWLPGVFALGARWCGYSGVSEMPYCGLVVQKRFAMQRLCAILLLALLPATVVGDVVVWGNGDLSTTGGADKHLGLYGVASIPTPLSGGIDATDLFQWYVPFLAGGSVDQRTVTGAHVLLSTTDAVDFRVHVYSTAGTSVDATSSIISLAAATDAQWVYAPLQTPTTLIEGAKYFLSVEQVNPGEGYADAGFYWTDPQNTAQTPTTMGSGSGYALPGGAEAFYWFHRDGGSAQQAVSPYYLGASAQSGAYIPGFQITAVPEPGSLALCGIGGMVACGWLAVRRRP
ncbi:MAG: hypothetical protein RLZZ303_137 [Candidatus Hydrogenedentota bacterium]